MLILYSLLLLAALAVILAGAELFTNSLEHVGQRFHLSEGLVGSVFAAVATALPETVVPIIAVFFGGHDATVGESVGVGAILGSPLMLVTLALALVALFTGSQRGWNQPLKPEFSGMVRDLGYFTVAYSIALMSLFVPRSSGVPAMTGLCLVFLYGYYVFNTIQASARLVRHGHGTRAEQPLRLQRLGLPHNLGLELLQLLAGVVLIIVGAKLFVMGVEEIAARTGLSALVLSLVVVPIATEMPEKFNSILWVRRGKDTLAFGNLTGAMVFQGTLLLAFGMQLSSWAPSRDLLWTMAITLGMALWTLFLTLRRRLTPASLLLNGAAYLLFLLVIFGLGA
ncbi:MAG TPA: sodium:calcium antiporter [Gammaproteobacteria bacterium]